jgi:hypothetical protein
MVDFSVESTIEAGSCSSCLTQRPRATKRTTGLEPATAGHRLTSALAALGPRRRARSQSRRRELDAGQPERV